MKPSNDLIAPIRNRYSPLIFQDKPISEDDLQLMLEAARWAPSSFNEQPWRFLIGRKGSETWEKIFDGLADGNQAWAKSAPVLMVSVAKTTFDYDGSENPHAWHDVGLAMENMILQAASMDVYVHQMAGFDADMIRHAFDVPDAFEPVAAAAFGYEGDVSALSGKLKERAEAPRERRPIDAFAFEETWEQPFS